MHDGGLAAPAHSGYVQGVGVEKDVVEVQRTNLPVALLQLDFPLFGNDRLKLTFKNHPAPSFYLVNYHSPILTDGSRVSYSSGDCKYGDRSSEGRLLP